MRPLSPLRYLLYGLSLLAIKVPLDILCARWFHIDWTPWIYWIPIQRNLASYSSGSPRDFYLTLLAISIPFTALGIWLSLRRLRSARLPLWTVILFFIPAANLLFFAVLCAFPSRSAQHDRPPPTPTQPLPQRHGPLFAIASSAVIGALSIAFALLLFPSYGWGIFVAIPFGIGLITTLLSPTTPRIGLASTLLALGLTGIVLLAVAAEGILCLLMATPLALPLALLGSFTAREILKSQPSPSPATLLLLLLFTAPVTNAIDSFAAPQPTLFPVVTAIDIDAPPASVWPHVIQFPELPPPTELPFRLGIAYPIRARIAGSGPGAIRYCEFSTGPFVEPITSWQEPSLLAFDVRSSPAPMQELSPYNIHPPHLDGFLTSVRGQFRLIPLDNGRRTRLEGTTWYRHRLYPESYWRLWSDRLIHAIHLRVLEHIRIQTLAVAHPEQTPALPRSGN